MDIRKFFKSGNGSGSGGGGGSGSGGGVGKKENIIDKVKNIKKNRENRENRENIKTHIVFTDGSTINNGKKGAIGGIGIFFSDNSSENVSMPLRVIDVTNNKCELEAVRRAIKIIVGRVDFNEREFIKIYTDSKYLIDCITKWSDKWAANGWRKSGSSQGKSGEIKNLNLIKEIKLDYMRYNIQFCHVKAHTTFTGDKNSEEYRIWYGNFKADELAMAGTLMN